MTLITRLMYEHNAVVQYVQESHYKDGFLDGMEKAIDIIKNHNGWINVDDDTPKIKGRYLCYYPNIDKQAVEPFMLDGTLNNKEYMKALGISHWQPTPPNPTTK